MTCEARLWAWGDKLELVLGRERLGFFFVFLWKEEVMMMDEERAFLVSMEVWGLAGWVLGNFEEFS